MHAYNRCCRSNIYDNQFNPMGQNLMEGRFWCVFQCVDACVDIVDEGSDVVLRALLFV